MYAIFDGLLLGLAQNLNKPTIRIGRLFGFGLVKMKAVGNTGGHAVNPSIFANPDG